MALTPKQARFVVEYLIDLNATQAASRAGYSRRTANEQGARLLAKVSVAAAIQAAQAKRSERTEITADRVLTELAKLAFSNIEDVTRLVGTERVPDLSKATRDQLAAVGEITVDDYTDGRGKDAREVKRVRLKMADKRAALVDLGRHLGMFVDKHEHTGKDGKDLIPEQVEPSKIALGVLALLAAAKDRGSKDKGSKE